MSDDGIRYTVDITTDERESIHWIASSDPAYATDEEWAAWSDAVMQLRVLLDRMQPMSCVARFEDG